MEKVRQTKNSGSVGYEPLHLFYTTGTLYKSSGGIRAAIQQLLCKMNRNRMLHVLKH